MPRSAAVRAAAGDTLPDPDAAGDARRQQRARLEQHLRPVLDAPPERLVRALGPVPAERIARERWEREARRLEALRLQNNTTQQPAPARPMPHSGQSTSRRSASTPQPLPERPAGPAIGP
jgi:hypothetical protein